MVKVKNLFVEVSTGVTAKMVHKVAVEDFSIPEVFLRLKDAEIRTCCVLKVRIGENIVSN